MYTGNSIANLYNLRTLNFKANDVADAIDASQGASWGGVSSGTSIAYTCAPTPAWTSLQAGDVVRVTPHTDCGQNATIAVGGTAVSGIYYMGKNTVGGEMVSGVEALLIWDGSTWNLLNHGGGWATWTPTYGATGSMTYGSVTTLLAKYQRHGRLCIFRLLSQGTTAGTASPIVTFTLPLVPAAGAISFTCNIYDPTFSGDVALGQAYNDSGSTVLVWNRAQTVWGLGSGRRLICGGEYDIP